MARQDEAGAAIYTPWVLRFYDLVVLWLSNVVLWKCSSSEHLAPLYRSGFRRRHLDVGVGTGYFPAEALKRAGGAGRKQELTLVDLNQTCLDTAGQRVRAAARSVSGAVRVTTLVGDARGPLPLEAGERFDSISLFYLLHCIPGPGRAKWAVFDTMAERLADDGVLVGATVLGEADGRAGLLARLVMRLYNRWAIFGNQSDSQAVLVDGLRRSFAEVEAWTEGTVLLFRAQKPRRRE